MFSPENGGLKPDGALAGLNEELVQLLLLRDELHVEQDAMLVDIEDLTRWVCPSAHNSVFLLSSPRSKVRPPLRQQAGSQTPEAPGTEGSLQISPSSSSSLAVVVVFTFTDCRCHQRTSTRLAGVAQWSYHTGTPTFTGRRQLI